MAYTSDTLSLASSAIGSTPRTFSYTTADSNATIVGASYFSDGVTKGMKVGDLVDARDMTTPKQKFYQVASVSGTAATVAAITAIT